MGKTYTLAEAAKYLGIHYQTAREWVRKGKLKVCGGNDGAAGRRGSQYVIGEPDLIDCKAQQAEKANEIQDGMPLIAPDREYTSVDIVRICSELGINVHRAGVLYWMRSGKLVAEERTGYRGRPQKFVKGADLIKFLSARVEGLDGSQDQCTTSELSEPVDTSGVIKQLVIRCGIRVQDLCKNAEMSKVTYLGIANGWAPVETRLLDELAKMSGVDSPLICSWIAQENGIPDDAEIMEPKKVAPDVDNGSKSRFVITAQSFGEFNKPAPLLDFTYRDRKSVSPLLTRTAFRSIKEACEWLEQYLATTSDRYRHLVSRTDINADEHEATVEVYYIDTSTNVSYLVKCYVQEVLVQ